MTLRELLDAIHKATIPSAVPPVGITVTVFWPNGDTIGVDSVRFDAEKKEFFIHVENLFPTEDEE